MKVLIFAASSLVLNLGSLSYAAETAPVFEDEVIAEPEQPVELCAPVDGVVVEPIFVRGAFNLWSQDHPLCDRGDGVYQGEVTMDAEIVETHFKLAVSDWVGLMCSIDSQYPSEDLDELFSEVAAAPLAFAVPTPVTCYNEDERKEAELPLIFTSMKAQFVPLGVYQFSLDLSKGVEAATITVSVVFEPETSPEL